MARVVGSAVHRFAAIRKFAAVLCALVATFSAVAAVAAHKGHRKVAKVAAHPSEVRRTVVVARAADGQLWPTGRFVPVGSVGVVGTVSAQTGDGQWHTARGIGVGNVRCDLCAASAATAEPGVATILNLDLRAITNRLTTLQIRDTTVKVTSLAPFGLLVRKPF